MPPSSGVSGTAGLGVNSPRKPSDCWGWAALAGKSPDGPWLLTCGCVPTTARGVTHLRERRAPGGHGRGKHAPRPARPDAARAGQYPVVAARPLEDALAVHLAKWITEQLQACAIGVTEVE